MARLLLKRLRRSTEQVIAEYGRVHGSQSVLGIQRNAVPAQLSETGRLKIAFFGHDWTQNDLVKRVDSFQANGAQVTGFMFRRLYDKPPQTPSWENIHLGETRDGFYLRRVMQLLSALPTIWRHRRELRRADVVYARNTDMLMLALLSRLMTGTKAPVVYEILDVQPIFIGNGLVNRVLRFLERRLLAATSLLLVSSPTFMSRYFHPAQNFKGKWRLLENKVFLPPGAPLEIQRARKPKTAGPWVIGWFGVLRCQKSLEILCNVAAAMSDRVTVHIRGLPSVTNGITADLLRDVAARHANITYFGPYDSARDLEHIYGAVDIAWAVDYSAAGSNSEWLIPNRLYQGGLYGVPAIARAGTTTGAIVERDESGWCLAEPLGETFQSFMNGLDDAKYEAVAAKLRSKDPATFIDVTDTRDIVALMAELAGRPKMTEQRLAKPAVALGRK